MIEDPYFCVAECLGRRRSREFIVRGYSSESGQYAVDRGRDRSFAPRSGRARLSFLGFRVTATLENPERSHQSAPAP